MNELIIEKTENTPRVHLNQETGILSFEGRSYPENTAQFYAPVFEWITAFLKQDCDATAVLSVDFVYFNSSTSKVLFDLFELCDEYAEKGKPISIRWLYDGENEDCLEYGEEFKEDIQHCAFELLAK